MGTGRNSLYLASKGFQVEGVDNSQDNLNSVQKFAKEINVEISTHLVNLEKDMFIKEESYDAIICFNFLQRSLIPPIIKGLRPGGVIIYETYIIDQAQFGKPSNPDYLLRHNELLELFKDFRCLRYHEGLMAERKTVAGIVAEKTIES